MHLALSIAALILFPAVQAQAQGYRAEAGRIVVEGAHWRDWSFPRGAASIDAQGVVPTHIRSATNAIQGASILAAGSHSPSAPSVLDGDPATYWGPDIDLPEDRWWLEIDLGRTVNATRVVLRFVDEGLGDPFYKFNVLVSNGTPAFSGAKTLAYQRIGRTEQPNLAQRHFAFPIDPQRPADSGFLGEPIRFLLIQITDSRRGTAQELSQDQYEKLPGEERGEVEYYRREASGRERLVDRDQYQALATQNRGAVRYYRRERPRLADVEVWTAGDNLALGIIEREGRLLGFGSLGSEVLVADGDFTTTWSTPSAYATPVEDAQRNLFVDLGAMFWLERIQLIYLVTPASGPFPNYVMSLSDGSRAPDGSLLWTPVAAREAGAFNSIGAAAAPDQVISEYQAVLFPTTRARFFKLDYLVQVFFGCSGLGCSASVREIQFYGRGFLPQVTLGSGLVELGTRPRTLNTIHWDADEPEGTQLQVRTRTGNELERKIRYFNTSGVEVTQDQYRKLLSFQRGDSLIAFLPGPDWSPWSQPYERSGARIASPSPRRYLLVQAGLVSDRPEQAVRLRRLSVELSDPLATQLLGEIAPGRIQETGREQIFTLYLRPLFRQGDPGFDQVLLRAPSGAELSLVDVLLGSEEEHRMASAQRLQPQDLGLRPTGVDSLWIALPRPMGTGPAQLLALRFATTLFSASNTFALSVGLQHDGELVWQQTDPGDATALGDGQGLNVLAPFAERIIRDIEVRPNPFTPNQDGVNEVQTFAFSVFKIDAEKVLFLEVYTLDGRLLQRLEKRAAIPVGRQSIEWDGRTAAGERVPPGLYVCRFGLDVDDESRSSATALRSSAVVY